MTRADRKAIRDANRPSHGPADRTIGALLTEVDRLEAECTRRAQSEAALRGEVARLTIALTLAQANDERADLKADVARLTALFDIQKQATVGVQNIAVGLQADAEQHIVERDAAQRALAQATAREVALREALTDFWSPNHAHVASDGDETWHWRCETIARLRATHGPLLAAPADNAALREFGLRVARAVHENDGDGTLGGTLAEVVDAVLRGGAP
jgi:hypothetical protein